MIFEDVEIKRGRILCSPEKHIGVRPVLGDLATMAGFQHFGSLFGH